VFVCSLWPVSVSSCTEPVRVRVVRLM
jgi:hypothetical protein